MAPDMRLKVGRQPFFGRGGNVWLRASTDGLLHSVAGAGWSKPAFLLVRVIHDGPLSAGLE